MTKQEIEMRLIRNYIRLNDWDTTKPYHYFGMTTKDFHNLHNQTQTSDVVDIVKYQDDIDMVGMTYMFQENTDVCVKNIAEAGQMIMKYRDNTYFVFDTNYIKK